MPCVGFEPTNPASERAKTVHVLDRSAAVTGSLRTYDIELPTAFLNLLNALKKEEMKRKLVKVSKIEFQ
jgi:hypothetical protein